MHAKEIRRPMTLKRRIGYHDESEEEEEDIPDAARMKVDDSAWSSYLKSMLWFLWIYFIVSSLFFLHVYRFLLSLKEYINAMNILIIKQLRFFFGKGWIARRAFGWRSIPFTITRFPQQKIMWPWEKVIDKNQSFWKPHPFNAKWVTRETRDRVEM